MQHQVESWFEASITGVTVCKELAHLPPDVGFEALKHHVSSIAALREFIVNGATMSDQDKEPDLVHGFTQTVKSHGIEPSLKGFAMQGLQQASCKPSLLQPEDVQLITMICEMLGYVIPIDYGESGMTDEGWANKSSKQAETAASSTRTSRPQSHEDLLNPIAKACSALAADLESAVQQQQQQQQQQQPQQSRQQQKPKGLKGGFLTSSSQRRQPSPRQQQQGPVQRQVPAQQQQPQVPAQQQQQHQPAQQQQGPVQQQVPAQQQQPQQPAQQQHQQRGPAQQQQHQSWDPPSNQSFLSLGMSLGRGLLILWNAAVLSLSDGASWSSALFETLASRAALPPLVRLLLAMLKARKTVVHCSYSNKREEIDAINSVAIPFATMHALTAVILHFLAPHIKLPGVRQFLTSQQLQQLLFINLAWQVELLHKVRQGKRSVVSADVLKRLGNKAARPSKQQQQPVPGGGSSSSSGDDSVVPPHHLIVFQVLGVAQHDPARIGNPPVENKLISRIHVACAATAMALHHSFQDILAAAAAATAGPDTGRPAATDLDWPQKAVALVRMLLQLQQLLPQLEVVFASCDLLVQVMQIDSGVWKLAIASEANQELLLLLQPAVLQAVHQADRRQQQQQQQQEEMIDDTLRLSGVLLCEMALNVNSDHWKKAIVASPQVCCASLDVAFRTNGAAAAAVASGSSSIKMTDYMPPSGFFIAAREAMLTVQLALQEGKVLVALVQPTEAACDNLVQQQHAPFLFSVMATLLKCGAALRQADPENALLVAECVAGFGVRFSVAATPAAAAAAALGANAAVAELAASMGVQPGAFMSQLMSTEGAQAGARGRELKRMLWAASSALSGGSSGSGGDNNGIGGGGRNNSSETKSAGSWGRFGDIKTCSEIVQQGLFDFRPGGYNSSSNVGGNANVISNVWYKGDQIAVVTPWLVSAARSLFLIGQVLCEVLGEQQQSKQQRCKQQQQPQMIASPHLYEDVLLNAFACVEWLGSELCHVQLPEDAVDCDSKDASSSSSRGCTSLCGLGAGDCSTGAAANSHGSGCSHAALQQLLEQHSQTQQDLLQAVQRCLDTTSCSSNSGSDGVLTDTTVLQQFEQVWGLQTAQRLKNFAASMTAALPVGYCCNNPGCCNLSKLSELQLVAGSGKLCSQCRVARYCGPLCQKAHWKMHKAACKQLATQAAARQK